MSIRTKVLGVLAVLLLAGVTTIALVLVVQRDVRRSADQVERATAVRYSHGRLWRAVLTMNDAERGYLLSRDDQLRREYIAAEAEYRHDVLRLRALLAEPVGQDRLTAVESRVEAWQRSRGRPLHPQATAAEIARVVSDSRARFQPVQQAVQAFLAREKDLLAAAQSESRRQIRAATWLMVLIPGLATLLLVGLIVRVRQDLLTPLEELAESARRFGAGDMTLPAVIERSDEIGALVHAFRDMATAVRDRAEEAAAALAREQASSARLAEMSARAEGAHADLLQTVETVPAALMIFDRDGRLALHNHAAEILLRPPTGNAPRSAAPDFTLHDRQGHPLSADDYPAVRALRGEHLDGVEQEIRTAAGRTVPILVSAAPLRGHGGEVVGAAVAFQDITRLREVDRLKDEFVSVVSHELRTPLTSIRGSLQLVLDEPAAIPDPQHRALLQITLSNTERLIRIINDILDIAKIESGRIQLQRRPVPVATTVRLAVSNIESIARAGSVLVATDVASDLPPVFADPDRLVQALVNLLSNAVKFAPPNTTVSISAEQRRRSVAITVRDSGQGIPPEHMDQLFQKFQQIDGSASRRIGGTGLGLAITKAIVEQHGGRISVHSRVGAGTTFTITVPIALATDAGHAGAMDARPTARTKRLVLLVDDDEGLRRMVRYELEEAGYDVIEATNGQRAVALAHNHAPDVIALDLMMPGHDGWAAIRDLSGDPATAGIPIIVVSGLDDVSAQIGPGMRVVRKPLDGNLLLREIRRTLGDRQHARILVAENDDTLRGAVTQVLRRRGYDVEVARDGGEALAVWDREAVDLLVLDLRLPNVDGFEVIRRLRESGRGTDVPIIVLAGNEAGDSRLRSLQLGANVYVTRPDASGLVQAVERLLEQ